MKNLLPFEKINRIVLTKKKSTTSKDHGCNPKDRSVEDLIKYGVVNINKPKGPTSHQVSAFVQKILNIKKSGHSGTLDPKVTGALPVALSRATRVVQTLLTAGKEYVAIMHLHKEVSEKDIRKVCKDFTGKIKQLPPIKSAVKRQERYRKIYYIDIMEIDSKDVLFRVGCQAGTYIRKLIHDMGKKLGCGAHMGELIRTKAGPFDDSDMVSLQDLADSFHYYKNEKNEKYIRNTIRPMEDAINHLGKIWVMDSAIESICHGADLKVPGVAKIHSEISPEDVVVIMSLKDELIAFGISKMTSKQVMSEDKGLVVRIEKVFMEPGIYKI